MPDLLSAALIAHVAFGAVAVAAGAGALAARKGARFHIGAGRIFALAMGLSSVLGAGLGLANAETLYITFHAGILGVTLIASGWLTARERSGRLSAAAVFFSVANFANAAALITLGFYAKTQASGAVLGFAAEDYFFLSAMAGVAVLGDASLLLRGALSDKHRIARHLWRMCLGFFIAAGSAFTGPGAKAFPEIIRNSGILSLPELLIFLALVFWLVRTLWKGSPGGAHQAG